MPLPQPRGTHLNLAHPTPCAVLYCRRQLSCGQLMVRSFFIFVPVCVCVVVIVGGCGSIVVYFCSEVFQGYFPFSFLDYKQSDKYSGSFMTHEGAACTCLWWGGGWWG